MSAHHDFGLDTVLIQLKPLWCLAQPRRQPWDPWSSESLWSEHLGLAEKEGHGNLRQIKCWLPVLLFLFLFLSFLSKGLPPIYKQMKLKEPLSEQTRSEMTTYSTFYMHRFEGESLVVGGGEEGDAKEGKKSNGIVMESK